MNRGSGRSNRVGRKRARAFPSGSFRMYVTGQRMIRQGVRHGRQVYVVHTRVYTYS
jgi:hypothetical protein